MVVNNADKPELILEILDMFLAYDEKEHRPMLLASFPDWAEKVSYWNFEDDYLVSPNEVLPKLCNKVDTLLSTIHGE